MTRKEKLVHGVGINDSGYPVSIYAVVGGRKRQVWLCPIYQVWVGMLYRCYSAKERERHPTYAGCSVVPEWHSFSAFREWMMDQDYEGKQLDKDLLAIGNKLYSPDTCVFASQALNKFITDRRALRGNFPIGVHWCKREEMLVAQCNNPFTQKREHIGYFGEQEVAHEAWRARKHELACVYADQQTDARIAAALRSRYAKGEEL